MPYPSKFSAEAVVTARAFAETARPFPSLDRLAKRLQVNRRTIHRWKHKHPAFELALQAIDCRQRHWQHQLTAEEYRARLAEIDQALNLDVCKVFVENQYKR